MKTLLVCERSAGHIFPALAFAECLIQQRKCRIYDIYFFATSPFLAEYIKKKNFTVVGKGLKSRNILIEGFFRFFESLYIIIKIRPERVIGFGGRDSFFLVLFSSIFRAKTAIYDPNVIMGKANKALSFFVKEILRGFKSKEKNKKEKIIGIPLRQNIKIIDKKKARQTLGLDDQRPVILCLGGSQGSVFLNEVFIKFVQKHRYPLQVIHLTGKDEYLKISQFYNKTGMKSFVKDFYFDIEIPYSAADIVVSRAGAVTLAEISYFRLPSVLIPLIKAGGHQRENTIYLERRGAAFVCPQKDFSFERFSHVLESLIQDEDLRQSMSNNIEGTELGVGFEEFCSSGYF